MGNKRKGNEMNRNKQKYVISVYFRNYTKKYFIRYFKGDFKLKNFFEKINKKYGSENIEMILA